MDKKSLINTSNLPRHVAIIMDGNGRWAKEHNKPRIFGHKHGVLSVRSVVEAAGEIGIDYLTLYAFSTENWNRPRMEVTALMQLLVNTISNEVAELSKNNVRLMTIGDLGSLPNNCQRELNNAIENTKNNTGLTLVLALSYSSKWELTHAVQQIARQVQQGSLQPEEINQTTIDLHLQTNLIPDPELLIRTSGEHRISNFLLWQIAYSELVFSNKLWPDFSKEDFFDAIIDYQKRERRFGLTSEQVVNE
ncbi:MAG: isoprenyl transferase [Flavobacteriales bacterium]|nr:isoprenyl transferase [Flavobacteriales bacterium]